MNKNVDKYIHHRYKKIEGWISSLALGAIVKLSHIQYQNNLNGSVCEIRIHTEDHLYFFICLQIQMKRAQQ